MSACPGGASFRRGSSSRTSAWSPSHQKASLTWSRWRRAEKGCEAAGPVENGNPEAQWGICDVAFGCLDVISKNVIITMTLMDDAVLSIP